MEEHLELVNDDVTAGLAEYFTPTQGFLPAAGFAEGEPISNGRHTAIVWEYHGRHTAAFQGVQPTGREVVIRGTTVVDVSRRSRPVFHRYVDWLDVMGQLGMTSTHRPALDEIPGRRRARGR